MNFLGFNMVRYSLYMIFVALIGCASPAIYIDGTLNETNSGTIYIYKPKYEFIGFAADLRIHVDTNYVGSLRGGRSISTRVTPGEHHIDVGVYTFGSPGGSTAELSVNVAAGETVYVRTSSEIPPGGLAEAAVGWDRKHLNIVGKSSWENRE